MQPIPSTLLDEIGQFIAGRRSMQLATINEWGTPHASYAPFVWCDGGIYILISELASHTRDLLTCPQVSVLLIEDEAASRQIFARRRLVLSATADPIRRDSAAWQDGTRMLEARFGRMVPELCALSDFQLFYLLPSEGRYVKGFGQAYELDSESVARLDPPVG